MLSIGLLRSLAALAVPLILAATAYAFTAANTVPDSFAGDGSEAISGYEVSDITYTVGGAGDDEVHQVDFTLDSATGATYIAPDTVTIKLTAAGSWYSCTVDGMDDTSITCDTSAGNEKVADVDNLRVLAAQ